MVCPLLLVADVECGNRTATIFHLGNIGRQLGGKPNRDLAAE